MATTSLAHKIVIGVDFGTTFTGVSWASSEGADRKTLEDIHCIRDWPGPGRDADYTWKTPSRIAYDDVRGIKQWGFEVLPKMKSHTWMKLLLDPEQATKYDDPELAASEGQGVLVLPAGKTAVDVCTDFLSEVANFALLELKRRVEDSVLQATPLEFWFTVPAVWSDSAKADTLKLAEQVSKRVMPSAGAGAEIFLIREPEAAAIAALSTLTKGGSQTQVKPGDGVLICDCGGGTVDITTYTIGAVTPKLTFEELLVGTGQGGKCGSTYIDRQFMKWMEETFGDDYRSLNADKKGLASKFMLEFERAKKDFGKSIDPHKSYDMTLYMPDAPGSKHFDSEEWFVKVYHADMVRFFQPIVSKIINMLQDQVAKAKGAIKTIILVGGFGDSVYVNDRVKQLCQQVGGIRLICPEHPQAAIVRGAALGALQNIQPSSRRSRHHYGFEFSNLYDPRKHAGAETYIEEWSGLRYAEGVMHWNLAKDAQVDSSTDIRQDFFKILSKQDSSTFTTHIWCCELDVAPTMKHLGGNNIRKLGALEVDFGHINLDDQPSKILQGTRRYRITGEIRILFGQKRGVLEFKCFMNGHESGVASVSFDSAIGD